MSSDGWGVLRHRDLVLLCMTRFWNTCAFLTVQVAVGWYVYDVTRDAFALAYLGLASLLPSVALVLVSGYATDRIEKRLLIAVSNGIMFLVGLALVALVIWGYGLIWPVYTIVFILSAARSFFNTGSQAIVPNLVPREELGNAVAFASSAHQTAMIIGPAIGGILYAVSPALSLSFAAVCWIGATVATSIMRNRDKPGAHRPEITLKSLAAGFAFTSSRQVVLAALLLDAVAAVLTNLIVILPIFAKDVLDVGPVGLGMLRAAPAVGGIAMGLLISGSEFIHHRPGIRMLQTVAVFGLATAVFGFSESFLLSLVALAVVGASNMISVVIRHTLVQADTPDELRGRVAAVNSLYAIASGELGQVRAGVMAGVFGPVFSVVFGGLATLALVVAWPIIFPELHKRKRLMDPGTDGSSVDLKPGKT